MTESTQVSPKPIEVELCGGWRVGWRTILLHVRLEANTRCYGMKSMNITSPRLFTCLIMEGHCVLEMPSGTGKTVSLLSLIVSYQQVFLLLPCSSYKSPVWPFWHYSWCIHHHPLVLPYETKTSLLLPNSSWNRESLVWIKAVNGLSNIVRWNGRRKRKRTQFHRAWSDKPQEFMLTSWGECPHRLIATTTFPRFRATYLLDRWSYWYFFYSSEVFITGVT